MMNDADYILNDIKDILQEVFVDNGGDCSKYNSYIDLACCKIGKKLDTEIEDRNKRIEQLEGEIDSFEDGISDVESELDDCRIELKEAELVDDSLALVAMFRRAGGFCHDVTYGHKPLF